MLGHGYITIGSTTLPNPVDFSISYENNETENKSEAGTALVSVTRLLRRYEHLARPTPHTCRAELNDFNPTRYDLQRQVETHGRTTRAGFGVVRTF